MIEAISRPLGKNSYWLVHHQGMLVGRIVDRTVYEPVQLWRGGEKAVAVEGTHHSMLRFEAQTFENGGFVDGPVFDKLSVAHQFLVE